MQLLINAGKEILNTGTAIMEDSVCDENKKQSSSDSKSIRQMLPTLPRNYFSSSYEHGCAMKEIMSSLQVVYVNYWKSSILFRMIILSLNVSFARGFYLLYSVSYRFPMTLNLKIQMNDKDLKHLALIISKILIVTLNLLKTV